MAACKSSLGRALCCQMTENFRWMPIHRKRTQISEISRKVPYSKHYCVRKRVRRLIAGDSQSLNTTVTLADMTPVRESKIYKAMQPLMNQRNQNHRQEDRVSAILRIMKEVERSPLSVNQYFKKNATPFGRCQYYLYRKVLDQKGIQGLYDQRNQGNNVKFTHDMRNFVLGMLKYNRSMTCSEIQHALTNEFGVAISATVLNDFRREHGLRRIRNGLQESGACEMVIALALDSGFMKTVTDVICRHVQQKRASEPFRASLLMPKDHSDLRSHGQFTPEYNQSPDVRASRFQSLDEKIDRKRLGSMEIFTHSRSTTMRYVAALFSLPFVTMNGRIRSVDNPRGNALQYLCGYNYKSATLTKYLSELKYLQMADELIATTARFWIDFWSRRNTSETMFACYYIDGNMKALWSSKPCHKGKVTMLGRVMNCLEQVFIHDGYGHPIYFQTFNGHTDLGKNALCMLDKLSDYLKETGNSDESFSITRILIFDGGGNGVKTLRGLCRSEYHFITILDANQVNERKLKSMSPEKKYAYGDAHLVDCAIELEDSNEKGYIFETRAVQVHWDNQRMCVPVTSLSKDIFSPDNVVKSYFDRWPMQELNFRNLKSRVNIHRIVGYGKKTVDNATVLMKIEQLRSQINGLENALEEPLHQIREMEDTLQVRIREETTYREKSRVVDGERKLSENDMRMFRGIQKEINSLRRQIRNIKKADAKLFTSLKKKKTELARIIDKKKIYRVDVELDQIMTCFKISFANMCAYLLTECFKGENMTLQRLFETIFDLRGQMRIEGGQRHVCIVRNPKQADMMRKLEYAFDILNHMEINDLQGHKYHFQLV